jgi:hypothetical protein
VLPSLRTPGGKPPLLRMPFFAWCLNTETAFPSKHTITNFTECVGLYAYSLTGPKYTTAFCEKKVVLKYLFFSSSLAVTVYPLNSGTCRIGGGRI